MALLLILSSIPIDLHLFFSVLYKRTNLKVQSTIYALITFILLTVFWVSKGGGRGEFEESIFMMSSFISAIIWFIALIKITKNDYYLKTIDTVDKRSKILLYSFILNILIIFILAQTTDIVYLIKNFIRYYFELNAYIFFAGAMATTYQNIFLFLRIALPIGQFIYFVILNNEDLQNKNIEKKEEHRND